MKKIMSVLLTLSLMLTMFLYSTSFADGITKEVTIDGEKFITKEIQNDSNIKIVTVENNNSITKSEYDKDTKQIKIYKLQKEEVKNFSNQNEDFKYVTSIDTSSNKEPQLMSSYDDTYNSPLHRDYKYTCVKADSKGKYVFILSIPKNKLQTPMVSSESKAYSNARDFKSDLISADEYTEGAISTGFSFVPVIGKQVTIAGIIDSLSFQDLSKSDFASALLGSVELVPGLGDMVSAADFVSKSALASAKLYNVRQDFKNVKKYI